MSLDRSYESDVPSHACNEVVARLYNVAECTGWTMTILTLPL